MSVARVFRVDCPRGTVAVKASPGAGETEFYRLAAPHLRERGVPIVSVEWLGDHDGEHWLVLEWLPRPLTRSAPWSPDPRVVAGLVRLHHVAREVPIDLRRPPQHLWRDGALDLALSCFADSVARSLEPLLERVAERCGRFRDGTWISGDASPANWGERLDGTAAQFDWELFRPGALASDLAPAVPGLAPLSDFRSMASAYLAECSRNGVGAPLDPDGLTGDMVAAKAVTVVALLLAHVERRARIPPEYLASVTRDFPEWLRTVVEAGAMS